MVSLTDAGGWNVFEARMPLREARAIGLVLPAVLARYNIVFPTLAEAGLAPTDGRDWTKRMPRSVATDSVVQ